MSAALSEDDRSCVAAMLAYATQHGKDLYEDGESSTSEMWRKLRRGRELIAQAFEGSWSDCVPGSDDEPDENAEPTVRYDSNRPPESESSP